MRMDGPVLRGSTDKWRERVLWTRAQGSGPAPRLASCVPGSGNLASLLVLRASVRQVPGLWDVHGGWEPLQSCHLYWDLCLAAYWSP